MHYLSQEVSKYSFVVKVQCIRGQEVASLLDEYYLKHNVFSDTDLSIIHMYYLLYFIVCFVSSFFPLFSYVYFQFSVFFWFGGVKGKVWED